MKGKIKTITYVTSDITIGTVLSVFEQMIAVNIYIANYHALP